MDISNRTYGLKGRARRAVVFDALPLFAARQIKPIYVFCRSCPERSGLTMGSRYVLCHALKQNINTQHLSTGSMNA